MARYKSDYRGIRRMLKEHPGVIGGCVVKAGQIASLATITAPRRTGKYSESFEVSVVRRKDRTLARVTNTHRAALSIEYGTRDTPAHHTLLNATYAGARVGIR